MASADITPRIGIRNIKPGKDLAFEPLHGLGFVLGFMVIAAQVEEAVHGEMREVMQEGRALRTRFALGGFVGDYDVAEQRGRALAATVGGGKGQHVGGLVEAAPRLMERTNSRIVGQYDGKLRILR